jgi:hypothetical protein
MAGDSHFEIGEIVTSFLNPICAEATHELPLQLHT